MTPRLMRLLGAGFTSLPSAAAEMTSGAAAAWPRNCRRVDWRDCVMMRLLGPAPASLAPKVSDHAPELFRVYVAAPFVASAGLHACRPCGEWIAAMAAVA